VPAAEALADTTSKKDVATIFAEVMESVGTLGQVSPVAAATHALQYDSGVPFHLSLGVQSLGSSPSGDGVGGIGGSVGGIGGNVGGFGGSVGGIGGSVGGIGGSVGGIGGNVGGRGGSVGGIYVAVLAV
jgi:hypothetical protein